MNYKITFCTVCMNRLHHIKQTLPQNILDNLHYPHVEFLVLDYNSSDHLKEWILSELSEYIESGIVKFFRTEDVDYFDRSHSRNMMFKLASGDIVCNVDADNYTGKDFAHYINEEFKKDDNIYLVADTKKRYYFLRNAFGRFALKKDTLLALGGLDEKMKSYGSETVDLYERLTSTGVKEVVIQNTNFLTTISHGDEERISNEFFLQQLAHFYMRFISQEESEFIILYKDQSFESGYIVPEREETYLPAALKENSLVKGEWINSGDRIALNTLASSRQITAHESFYMENGKKYFPIEDRAFLLNIAKNYSFITNVDKKKQNLLQKNPVVNSGIFGRGTILNAQNEKMQVF